MAGDELDVDKVPVAETAYQVEELLRSGEIVKAKDMASVCLATCKDAGIDADTALALKTFARARVANFEQDEAIGSINEAATMYKNLGDALGEADCLADLAKLFMDLEDSSSATQTAQKAMAIYKDLKSVAGIGSMLHVQSIALRSEGDDIAALRMAEKASEMLVQGGDLWTEVESMIVVVQMKLAVSMQAAEHRGIPGDKVRHGIPMSTVHMAKAALSLAKSRRPGDLACEAEASLTYAQVLLTVGANGPAALAAKDASVNFRRAHDMKKRGRAMLVHSSATARGGDWKYALKVCEKATALLDDAGDEAGRENAFQILDEIDDARRKALGLQSLAEEQAIRNQALQDKQEADQQNQMMAYQQQMMMMQMMGGMGGGGGAAAAAPSMRQMMPAQPKGQPQQGPEGAPAGAEHVMVQREGGPLAVGSGMDPAIVRAKILEIATQIIGDDDEPIESDMPLMQAGLTSNTAVLLRDELQKDLPGVHLPPTLMFDYPSIAAIAEYVVDKANGK